MNIRLLALMLVLSVFSNAQELVSIIPEPVSLVVKEGSFVIDKNTSITYNASVKDLKAAIDFFNQRVESLSGYRLPINGKAKKIIQFSIGKDNELGSEGYTLNVTPSSMKISANTPAGLIYAMQSIFQTLPAIRTNATLSVPAMEIRDYPRFQWRGMHLDVSRHFFSPELVKSYIDLMATYKMNRFHWHLVDDQGWRIEIKKYPKLTGIGAWRVDHNDEVWGVRPQAKEGEKPTYGGYYTQEQVKEIVNYAAKRNVTIVPEIEMPGHVASAIAAYPQLSCTQQPQLPMTGGNYSNISSNYCPGNDSVFTFLQNVLDEVLTLFPSKYIHIGGDEVDKTPWKKCPKCQARMKKEGLKNEEELQSYFIKRMEKYLISKNRKMIGWDEILEGGLAPEATVMSWRGEAGGIHAAKMGHDVVMTPGSPLYFDHYQAGPEGEPMAFGGMNTLKKVYSYEPIPKELTKEEGKYVLGAQANLWTEYITTREHVEYMVLPRMLALAEVVWSPKEARDWKGFNERLKYHFKVFDQEGLHYSKGNFKVDIKPASDNGRLMVELSTEQSNAMIYYTLDGSLPDINSTLYEKPIQVNSSVVLKAMTAIDGKMMGLVPSFQHFVMHKAIGRAVEYTNPVSTYYTADGPNSLTDGVRGTGAVGKYWHGFSGKDVIATIDLGKEQEISSIALGSLQHTRDWIFFPTQVKFELSADGKSFKEVALVKNDISVQESNSIQKDFEGKFPAQKARFIRVTAKVLDAIPKGHPGEGKPAWVFVDEIIVK